MMCYIKLSMKNLELKSVFLILLFSVLLFSACKKKSKPAEPAVVDNPVITTPIVVVSDTDYVLTQEFRKGNNALILWKDGVSTDFTDGTEEVLGKDMKIVGNDVYILANVTKSNGNRVIRIWKNGVSTDIAIPNAYINSSAMAISGGDVYIVGEYTNNNQSTTNVAYWKNGVKTNLINNVYYSGATCIKILGNDVYIGGYERDTISSKSELRYWKNGVKMEKNNSLYIASYPTAIDVEGNNVYLSGIEKDSDPNFNKKQQPAYWINNGQTNFLPQSNVNEDEYAEDLKISNGIVYIVGRIVLNNKFKAVLWKSNTPSYSLLDNSALSTFAEKIQVNGSDIYVGGYERTITSSTIAKIWKNGIGKTYQTPNAFGGSAFVAMYFK
jgi:hypothetical protein